MRGRRRALARLAWKAPPWREPPTPSPRTAVAPSQVMSQSTRHGHTNASSWAQAEACLWCPHVANAKLASSFRSAATHTYLHILRKLYVPRVQNANLKGKRGGGDGQSEVRHAQACHACASSIGRWRAAAAVKSSSHEEGLSAARRSIDRAARSIDVCMFASFA